MLWIYLVMIVIVLLISRVSDTAKDFITNSTFPASMIYNQIRALLVAAIFWPVVVVSIMIYGVAWTWLGLEWIVKRLCFTKKEQKEMDDEDEKNQQGYVKTYVDKNGFTIVYEDGLYREASPPPIPHWKPPASSPPPPMRIIDEDIHWKPRDR